MKPRQGQQVFLEEARSEGVGSPRREEGRRGWAVQCTQHSDEIDTSVTPGLPIALLRRARMRIP